MTNTTNQISIRGFWLLLLVVLWSLGIKAQQGINPVLTWDKEVGCIIRTNNKEDVGNYTLYEQIRLGLCLRVCEYSNVKYTFTANNLRQVTWQVSGGSITNSSNNHATVSWNAAGNASLTLLVTYTNNTTETLTLCVEKIKSPSSEFQIAGIDPGQAKFCLDTPINFDNISHTNGGTDIINYLWDFGDGTTTNAFEPTHSYSQTGYYKVTLTVTNSCNCSSTYSREIYIYDSAPFEISCPSIVCEKSIATYTVSDNCENGDWKVKGGTIINNRGNSIQVRWDNVDPIEGFGYVSYQSKCTCPVWSTVKVPVILATSKIIGPGVICTNSQGLFTLPQWPSTDFQWMINDNANHPFLVRTDQRNEIMVNGTTPGTYTLKAKYRNTLIDNGNCSGEASIQFTIGARPTITSPTENTICPATTKTFGISNNTSVQWTITLNGSTVHTATGNTTQYNFPNSGTHIVTANYNGCITEPLITEVIKTGVINGEIKGQKKVCLNTPYTYNVTENDPGYIYTWQVTNGSIIGTNSGRQVDIKFTAAGTVSVVKEKTVNGVTCKTPAITLAVEPAVLNPIITNLEGLSTFCPSTTSKFSLNLGDIEPDHIEWSILSSTGATNFGNITDGKNSKLATVSFNNVIDANSVTGVLQAAVTKCGKTIIKTYPITIIKIPTLSVAPIQPLCAGTSFFSVNLTSTPMTSGTVKIDYHGEAPTTTAQFTNGTPLVVANRFRNNTSSNITKPITFHYEVCGIKVQATLDVTILPPLKITVGPHHNFSLCSENYIPFTLYASVPVGLTNVTYLWYKNGTSTGVTTSTYTVSGPNPAGRYQAYVTDLTNGCTTKSPEVNVQDDCSVISNCTISPDPNVNLSVRWTKCEEFEANVSFSRPPDKIIWNATQHLTLVPPTQQNPQSVKYTTDVVGGHYISVLLQYGNCTISKKFEIIKDYQAKMKTRVTCNRDGTYKVELLNNSDLAYAGIPVTYTYTGPGITGPTSGQNHTIPRIGPGNHTYTLTLSSPGKPNCSVSVPVNIGAEPNANFTLSPLNYCAEDLVLLNLASYNSDYIYEWFFNGTSFTASGIQTPVRFTAPGTYPIKLTITTPYGCSYTSTNNVQVQIRKANFNVGIINPSPAEFCASSATPLSFTVTSPTSSTLSNIIWMKDNEEVGTGLTYQPTRSGNYWPVLIDQNGCKSHIMVEKSKPYILRQPPFASVEGKMDVCFRENTVLTGITTDPNVEFRWTGPNVPTNLGNWSTATANKTLQLNGLAQGTYEYFFHTRVTSDASCANSFKAVVQVHPAVTIPTITANVINCNPYTIRLTATGPITGTYNWSNGMTGRIIEVPHGGAYSVTYTATTGCSATGYIQAPQNPERSLWVVPQGCYTVCNTYLLGPLGRYENYQWKRSTSITQSGNNTVIPNQIIQTGGIYSLSVTQNGCTFVSNKPNIAINSNNCAQKACNFKVNYLLKEKIPGGLRYQVTITNSSGPQMIYLTSFNGYGTFSPAVHTIINGTNNFMVDFFVNANYAPGVTDQFVATGDSCATLVTIKLENAGINRNGLEAPSLVLSPNPTTDITYATYNIGTSNENAQYLIVYDLLGVQRYKQKISDRQAEVALEINHLAQGTYLISLEADGKRITTEKLIKK